jgi:hypothetical protein
MPDPPQMDHTWSAVEQPLENVFRRNGGEDTDQNFEDSEDEN